MQETQLDNVNAERDDLPQVVDSKLCPRATIYYANDDSVIRRAKDGDQTAATELLERYRPLIFKSVARFRDAISDLDDRLSLISVTFCEAIRTFDLGSGYRFGTYFKAAIKYAFFEALRKATRRGIRRAPRKGPPPRFASLDAAGAVTARSQAWSTARKPGLLAEVSARTTGGMASALASDSWCLYGTTFALAASCGNGCAPRSTFELLQLAAEDDRLDARRLRKIGRQKYALELCPRHLTAANLTPASPVVGAPTCCAYSILPRR
jgi:hypothetical protein